MLAIVSKTDKCLYQQTLFTLRKQSSSLHEFFLHASLDMVDAQMWQQQQMYLKQVDKVNQVVISAFITPSSELRLSIETKLLLLHEGKSDESVKNFFSELYELYVKTVMNPLYEENSTIESVYFEERLKMFAKKFF